MKLAFICAYQDNYYTNKENTNTKTSQESHTGQKNVNITLFKNIVQKVNDTGQLKTMESSQKSECNGKWKLPQHKKSTN